jgi:hypothetical protein
MSNFTSINTWHSDLWIINFSNIPTVVDIADLQVFESYVKSISFPEYSVENDEQQFNGFKILTPIATKANTNLTLLQIEFKISENFKNYTYLFQWIYNIRHGLVNTELLRKYWIESININIMDNMKRIIGRFELSHCFISNLSSFGPSYGVAEEVSFMATFNYEKIDWIPIDIGNE